MKIYNLESLPANVNAGGKAKGLKKIIDLGLKVSRGFVLTDIKCEEDYLTAFEYYEKSGMGAVAVRSSAGNEDGCEYSFAGQYSTFLNIKGKKEFINAIKSCLESLESVQAREYNSFFKTAEKTFMAIIIQEMVNAECAGVCFTIDPLSGEKVLIVEAVKGLGEALVSGEKKGEHYRIKYFEDGGSSESIVEENKLLSDELLSKIRLDALSASDAFGIPLDLEWAINEKNELIWLQARPITTLDEASIDELDSFSDENCVYTTCNIGEMLPGAVTPLSLSTSVQAIDHGLRRMLINAGVFKDYNALPPSACLSNFSNTLFFNLTMIYKMNYSVFGAYKDMIEMNICGRVLDTPEPMWRKRNLFLRLRNGGRYGKFLFSNKKALNSIDKLADAFKLEITGDIYKDYENLTNAQDDLRLALWYHYITSSHSGALSGALLQILTKELGSEEKAREALAGMLENIEGIESADILVSLKRLAKEIIVENPDSFKLNTDELEMFLVNSDGALRKAYDYFLDRHGHRAIREAELRSKSWKNDLPALMRYIKTIMETLPLAEENTTHASAYYSVPLPNVHIPYPEKDFFEIQEDIYKNETVKEFLKTKKGIKKKLYAYVIKNSRIGVRNREYTKSKFVKIIDRIKEGYTALSENMFKMGVLPDTDLIYFVTHEEIGRLIKNKEAKLIKTAIQRRRLLPIQQNLEFQDLYIGKPKPIKRIVEASKDGTILVGSPISRGEITGIARVVLNIEDARELKKGEIMVCAYTDIGWSPYYFLIGGLITEVGSALSHGAVVAREHSLPLIANVQNATQIIKTGDLISLNAYTGQVIITKKAVSPDSKQKASSNESD